MAPEILTAPEVAVLLRVSPSTVYRWAEEGRIPSFRVGGAVRFRADAINDLVDAGLAHTDAAL